MELLATTSIVRSVGHLMVRLPAGWGMKEVEGGRSNVQNTMIGQISVKGVAVHMVYSE